MNEPPVLRFQFPFSNELLLKEFEQVKDKLVPYQDERFTTPSVNWMVVPDLSQFNLPYVNNITLAVTKTYNIKGHISPHFYFLQKKSILRNHVDFNTKCAINHVIQGGTAPVTYPDFGVWHYETALLDTSRIHGVVNKEEDRILFKISIFDETYEQVFHKVFDVP